ncbi:IS66 family transposase [Antarcticibacterium flavum]|uniref:IS66 family transposase n=1 Tax=Antarcticibacterium flavum TaxID=2058175 RepID=A0A5B7X4C8_9FLAO|nr:MULTISPECIES: IS66 family transposase [Antarcticibacterium]MCM4161947.1 IS66 family transposase [Antarcticibacterium sp. W02-3]QCY69402.1 IS66 family transposase [Antarcticibacterium flavum]QCY70344.1 IS66 family transposase [Antarcticibacterium flavum]QCY70750.1 IS66 family transposase [Antarcticibacterium flavum]QCY70758.1 IS66 family transposase [Antarcticibacterium flavum]
MQKPIENLTKDELLALLDKETERRAKAEKENIDLKFQLAYYKRLAFGQKRERFEGDKNQMSLPFEMEPEKAEKQEAELKEKLSYERRKRTSVHKGRMALPEHLPVEEIEIYPQEDITDMICIGKEVTNELEYEPAKYYIKRYIRYKYAPKNKEGVIIGELPERVIEKGIPGAGLLASILVDKYEDHLPLYRQLQRFKRADIPIASSTLEGWTRQSLKILDILYQHLLEDTRSMGYLQADESPIKVIDKNKKGTTHQGYYWVYHNPMDGSVLFDYHRGRSREAADHVLADFKGYLQSDGYAAYDKIGKREGVTHLNCWAHARREFDKAKDNDRERAEIALSFIQKLYAVEAQAREHNLSPEQRKSLRLENALPIINEFAKWMFQQMKHQLILPKSPIGKAFRYSMDRWDQLSAYLYDGILEIDNNLIENAIRKLALGRKNYLFAGSDDAAQRGAIMYSFFAICKKHEVNPYEWLKYTLENIMSINHKDIRNLYPQNYKKLQQG